MDENIFIFVPNIIGYGRILLALISFYFMPTNYVLASVCYILSGFLDAFDGHAARNLNQATRFGAILDMLVDRCSTMALLVTLSSLYTKFVFMFQLSMIIDIFCHWLHVHTTIVSGQTSHKSSEANINPLLKLYYTSKPLLFIMCSGNELFYSMLYLLHFTEGPTLLRGIGIFRLMCYVCAPVAILKSVFALMQGYYAALTMAEIDVKERREIKQKNQ